MAWKISKARVIILSENTTITTITTEQAFSHYKQVSCMDHIAPLYSNFMVISLVSLSKIIRKDNKNYQFQKIVQHIDEMTMKKYSVKTA